MFPNVNGPTQLYLANLNRIQKQMEQAQTQISSGMRVQQASDDPLAVSEILHLSGVLGQNQQVQKNLGSASAELSAADSSLQSAIDLIQKALSIAAEGATATTSTAARLSLAQEVSGIQQAMVNLSNTSFNGRYIFSGDQDTQAAFQLDPANLAEGVSPIASGVVTRVIMDASGTSISVAKTAADIFAPKNGDGTPATGNVFAAIQSLLTSLQTDNQAGVAAAANSLKFAGDYLNNQLAFYGAAENRVANATDLAEKFQTQTTQQLGDVRNADVPTLAIQLSQAKLQNEAALSVESTLLQKKNLFDYVG